MLIQNLMQSGLTRHESELYVALLKEGELTGYEAAKITGIPRANAYQALSGLVDKGGAHVIEGAVPHYAAIPVEEYCNNLKRNTEHLLERIKQDAPAARIPSEPYLTVSGYKNIIDKMNTIIENARERVYVSLSAGEVAHVRQALGNAVNRGLKVVIISTGHLDIDGATVYVIQKEKGPIRIIADSSYVLTGEIKGNEDDICLYSRNRPLVELLKDSLKNEIRLSKLVDRSVDNTE